MKILIGILGIIFGIALLFSLLFMVIENVREHKKFVETCKEHEFDDFIDNLVGAKYGK